MNEIASIMFLATFVEGLIEYIFKNGSGNVREFAYGQLVNEIPKYAALVFGVALAVAYRIDIPAMIGLTSGHMIVSYIVSGLVIGRGSNYVNDIIGKIRA